MASSVRQAWIWVYQPSARPSAVPAKRRCEYGCKEHSIPPPPATCPHLAAPGRAVPFITVSRQSPRAALVNDRSDTNRWRRQPATGAPGSAVSLTPSRGRDLAGLRVPGKNTRDFHPAQARPGRSTADAGAASLMRPAGDTQSAALRTCLRGQGTSELSKRSLSRSRMHGYTWDMGGVMQATSCM